ncbi:MAG: amidophosphoribosyltransferase [Clostridia bacterium]|nr:amidophosphoribosyltransferase [Clostridia bacterium]
MSGIREECGVFGIFAPGTSELASSVYYGLFALQHRGQESCGIVVNDDGVFNYHKDNGIVNDVFTPDRLASLGPGNMALGHVRYATTGNAGRKNAQPMVVNHVKGHMALAHNGNLINSYELRKELELQGSIFHSTSDTEVISYIVTKERLRSDSIEQAVNKAMDRLDGAYSLIIMSPSKLIAARDPHGFRPLCYGYRESDGSYIIASESCAIDAVGGRLIREVEPGEVLVFEKNNIFSIRDHCGTAKRNLCVFEYIYFARPDSVIEGASVHEARKKAGEYLWLDSPVDADVVIGVPDSGLDAALGFAYASGIPYGIGFIKNKYIGRTFIAPGQKTREDRVRIKLNAMAATVKGKRVVMVDDSIVRGTTSGPIVKMLRDAGAAEVHVRISSPPFLNPCYYGTDIDSRENLIACHHTVEEIRDIIGADSLAYMRFDRVKTLTPQGEAHGLCIGCFSGEYCTRIPEVQAKSKFESKISENKEDE